MSLRLLQASQVTSLCFTLDIFNVSVCDKLLHLTSQLLSHCSQAHYYAKAKPEEQLLLGPE